MTMGTADVSTTAARRAALQDGDLRAGLDRMIEIRVLEEHVQQLFLQGLIPGTTHTCQGQEAVCVAVAGATRLTDRVLCTYRGHGWALALGMAAAAVLGEIMGRSLGCTGGLGGSMHLSDRALGLWPTVAIVGAQLPIAVGAAMASQTRADEVVTVAVFGDGAANIGAFHEALNLAGVWKLPVVFLCENNLYAEYSRIDGTTAVPDIASRAAAYAMPGVAVDGQSLRAMRDATREAVDRARAGGGPTLIEAKTYRFVGHSRSDPAKYRLPGELDVWKARDPVRLVAAEIQPDNPDALAADVRARWEPAMAAVVERVKAAPDPAEEDMFRYVYAGGDDRMYWAEHVGVIVSDMERSVKFYSGLFDSEPIQKVEFRGKGAEPVAAMVGQPGLELDVTFFKIPHTNTIIELVKYYHLPGQATVTYPPEAIGGLHLAFYAEDLDEAIKRLQRIGAKMMTPVNLIFGAYTGGRAVYFRGPDNELLQIMAVTQRPGKLPVLRPSMPAHRG